MRRLLTAAALTALVAATAGAARPAARSPCALVTAADAAHALGAAVGKPKLQNLGLYASCTYTAKSGPSLTSRPARSTARPSTRARRRIPAR
jgi:hypothetical protein